MPNERGKLLQRQTEESISDSACYSANSLKAAAFVAFTHSGSTAMSVSKYRPSVPILVITPDSQVSGRILLNWGVFPFQIEGASSLDDLFATAIDLAKDLQWVKTGDLLVITGGIPLGISDSTNLLKVETV